MRKIITGILLSFGITYATENNYNYFSNPFAQTQFVPDISLIGDFSYVSRNVKNDTYKELTIPGFIEEHHSEDEHSHYLNANRGFNLNYGELAIHSAVDPYFDLIGIFHLSQEHFEIEELYFLTRNLPYHLRIKGGKFLSSIGRLNKQHQHVWDFTDVPLVYKAFFGDEKLNEKGIQISWIAPTNFYLLLGSEILQGENEQSFGKADGSLYTGFIKSSYDIGNLTLIGGISYLSGKTENDTDSKIYGLDFTAKYLLDSYRYISWQSEYLYRDLEDLNKKQGGFYSQVVYRFSRRWRTGFRYDLLNKNTQNNPEDLDRYSFMIDFTPSEFSRLRFQYNYDRSKFIGNNRQDIKEFIVELNLVIGAHGAHEF
ncbi:hypothetical protein [Hydrogenothermus marinus]|uniref:Zinc-regulated TonB-dependent outer membrane receptor n=1 Tax=Hydrogenothermus marinus TaxID=133270 RepID=A0A3M0C305_9AQUI|nr:hypothetical protein [Hydrogenothermus marinus]RMA97332.1 hypothetical protein CLV39_0992 [Hydrogenothermus marinus]